MRKALLLLGLLVCACPGIFAQSVTQGSLFAADGKGKQLGSCPLKHTAVNVDISGFVARVRVVQEFENTFIEPIEAVYTFPLSQNGAVDEMTMLVGTRTVRGKILKREEARKVYETAKSAGQTAARLDQERPNIFTQSVANVMPGETVKIEISYVETLKYEDGAYEFVFPMTVGPRYMPGSVTDAVKISPPIAAGRAGHDVSINVNLNAGVPVESIRSGSHGIEQLNNSPSFARISLKNEKVIPNKDFILRYDVTGKRIEDAVIAHRSGRGGFFTMILQPPDIPAPEDRIPKEIVFVLDTSGSMSGFPIEKAKEAMKLSLDGLYPEDTFNLITFAGDTHVLFEEPVPATQANIEAAQAFLDGQRGGGGTEMMKAIKAALDPSDSKEHVRIVCFMTDAFVGNEDEIVAEIQRHPKARVFSFGIGSSVNRSLLDRMAEAGRGEVEYVSLTDDGSRAAKRFYERVRTPMLTDISIDWNGLPVSDVYPSKPGDLFSAKPVVVTGRFAGGRKGSIKLKGSIAGQPYEREIAVTLPDAEPANDSLASLWARKRIDQLSSEALNSPQAETINKQITDLGLEFRLMTQFTSFVAVEERVVNQNGQPVKIEVPVEAPEGVEIEKSGDKNAPHGYIIQGMVGRRTKQEMVNMPSNVTALTLTPGVAAGSGAGVGSGSGSGFGSGSAPPPSKTVSGGVVNGQAGSVSSVVEVTAAAPSTIDTRSSSITTKIQPDASGNFRVVPSSGGGGGGGREEKELRIDKPKPKTAEDQREWKLKQKAHQYIYRLIASDGIDARVSGFVRDGKAAIRVTVANPSAGLIDRLKSAGMEIAAVKGSTIVGRIDVAKLRVLLEMEEVTLVLPNR